MSIQLISASDVESAAAVLTDAYGDATVVAPRDASRVCLRLEVATLPNARIGELQISKSMVHSARYPVYTACLPLDGAIRISSRGEAAHVRGSSGAVVSPGEAARVEYLSDDCKILTVLFERDAIEAELAAMLGHPVRTPLRFDLQLTHVEDAPFARALGLLRGELDAAGGLMALPEMSARLGRLLMAGLLMSQPSNYSEELTRPRGILGPRAIKHAVELIEDRPAEIDTVADIAKAVGLSVRALDDGFRRYVGTPPMTYLREVRLARAHEELVAGDADVTTATDVAGNWGFWHYGRFAAAYRRR
jgi:AraC-like DNA-binding protein